MSRLNLQTFFPEIDFRRGLKRSLSYSYTPSAYEVFEKLILPGAALIPRYLAYSDKYSNIPSIKQYLYGMFEENIPEELKSLDLEGWRKHWILKACPPKVFIQKDEKRV